MVLCKNLWGGEGGGGLSLHSDEGLYIRSVQVICHSLYTVLLYTVDLFVRYCSLGELRMGGLVSYGWSGELWVVW